VSESMQINTLIERVLSGQVRIPGFQRGYVWDPQRVALLMDTIFKGYPYGTVLMWRSSERLLTEKALGGFVLPEPTKGYPLDYVLDGQQRITSIFRTFQTSVSTPDEDPEIWLPIYYDFEAVADAQESQFVALAEADVDPTRHFPLRSFFDPVVFANSYSALVDDRKREIAGVQDKFKGTLIPVQTFETDDRTRVAIVFERVNRMGIELNIFQLLTAWTWSEEFDLQQKFTDLGDELDAFGFHGVGSDSELMMRCCAAILKNDPSPTSLIDINGADMRSEFERIRSALKLAIDFLRINLSVINIKFLPYSALLIPLAAYFAHDQNKSVSDADRQVLLRWFWRTSFGHRYSGNPLRNVRTDVEEATKLRKGEASALGSTAVVVDDDYYLARKFNLSTVATRAFVLQLAQHNPRSFTSGSLIDLDTVLSEPNRSEFHHCYPRAYLTRGLEPVPDRISDLVNYAFLTRAENREISDSAPSVYRTKMPADSAAIVESQILSDSMFDDDWSEFRAQRSALLVADAMELVT
jgi:hypothetical protein